MATRNLDTVRQRNFTVPILWAQTGLPFTSTNVRPPRRDYHRVPHRLPEIARGYLGHSCIAIGILPTLPIRTSIPIYLTVSSQVSCYLKSLFTPELMEEEHRIWTKAMEDKVPTFYEGRTRDGKTKQTWTVLPFRTLWWDAGGHMFGMLDVLHTFRGQVPGRVTFRCFDVS